MYILYKIYSDYYRLRPFSLFVIMHKYESRYFGKHKQKGIESMADYIIAVDQSTTGTKAVLFDSSGALLHRAALVHKQYYPQPGWVEQDGEEIFLQTVQVIAAVLENSGVPAACVRALAITVQTGAFVVWDRLTGAPVHHIIGWQCNRGEETCKRLSAAQKEYILAKSGTDASAFLPAAKLRWMFDHIPGLYQRAQKGEVLFGTIESFLIWKLTGGKVHATDYCNASITQLFNNNTLEWDSELLEIFGVPRCILPEPRNADASFGMVATAGLPPLPITGVIGDSAAALFGQCGFSAGDAKVTYGTGSSILMNLGGSPQPPAEGMTTSVGWRMGDGQVTYVWEGTAVCTGAVISWLVNDLKLLPDAKSSETVASQVESAQGVYLVPAFSGLGTPYRDSEARACIVGMFSGVNQAHIVRAALDCIAYQIKDMLIPMEQAAGRSMPYLLVDGGGTANKLLMQFQSNILGIPVLRSTAEESSALGVFYMAGLATGMFQNFDELKALGAEKQRFSPRMARHEREELYLGWKHAIAQARYKG